MGDGPWSICVSEDYVVEQFSPSAFITWVLGSKSCCQACVARPLLLNYSPALSSFLFYYSYQICHLLFEKCIF